MLLHRHFEKPSAVSVLTADDEKKNIVAPDTGTTAKQKDNENDNRRKANNSQNVLGK